MFHTFSTCVLYFKKCFLTVLLLPIDKENYVLVKIEVLKCSKWLQDNAFEICKSNRLSLLSLEQCVVRDKTSIKSESSIKGPTLHLRNESNHF